MPQVWLWGPEKWQLSMIYHRPSPRQIYSKAAITQPSASHLSLLFPCSSWLSASSPWLPAQLPARLCPRQLSSAGRMQAAAVPADSSQQPELFLLLWERDKHTCWCFEAQRC